MRCSSPGRYWPASGLLLLTLLAAPAIAQERLPELSLGQALKLAVDNNADLAAAQSRVAALRATALQAGAWTNPSLNLRREDSGIPDTVDIAELTEKLEISGARGARRRAAGSSADAAQWSLAQARAQLVADVRTRFAEVLTAQQRLELGEQNASLADSLAQAVSRRVVAGKVSPIEETRARLITGTARIERSQAQRDLVSAHARLAALWNGAPDFERVSGNFEVAADMPPWADVESRVTALAPLRQADAEVNVRQADLDLERARRLPEPTVGGAYRNYRQRDETSYDVGITIPLPLFDRNSGAVAAASSALDEATAARRARLAGLHADLQAAWQRATAARSESQLLDTELAPAAQSAFDATRTGYELGKFNLLELLDVQRAWQQVRQQQLRAHFDAVAARAELDRLLDTGGIAVRP